MTYSRNQVPTTASDLRSLCAGRPAVIREATSGDLIGEAATFFYRDRRRRQINNPESYPAGLASVGDSAASCTPAHTRPDQYQADSTTGLNCTDATQRDPDRRNKRPWRGRGLGVESP